MPPLEDDSPEHFDLENALLSDETTSDDSPDSTPVNTNNKASLRDTLSRSEAEVTSSADDDQDGPLDDVEEEEVADDPAEEEAPNPETDLFARVAAKTGLDLKGKYQSEDDLIAGLGNAARLVGQRNQYAEYGRQLLENPQAVLESLQKLYGQKTAEASEVKKPSGVPDYDPAWLELFDAEGKLVEGADPTIPTKLKKYNEFLRDRMTKIATDPTSELLPLFKDEVAKLAKEQAKAIVKEETDRLRVEQERVEVMRTAEKLVQQEASWAFVDGDIRKGPTNEGKVLGKWLQVLETPDASGNIPIPDMYMRKEVAVMMARNEIAASKSAPADKSRQQKISKKPYRAATEPTDKSWPKGMSLEDALARSLSSQ